MKCFSAETKQKSTVPQETLYVYVHGPAQLQPFNISANIFMYQAEAHG